MPATIGNDDSVDIKEKDLLLFCKQNLAAYKIPKVVEIVKKLPKTSSGKIKRQDLMKELSLRILDD